MARELRSWPHIPDLGNLRVKMGEGRHPAGWPEHQSPVALRFQGRGRRPRSKIFPTLVVRYLSGLSFRAGDQQAWAKPSALSTFTIAISTNTSPKKIATISFIGEQMGSAIAKSLLEEENARLSEETAEMKRQPETRKSVERAKGILQKRHALSEEEAYPADA